MIAAFNHDTLVALFTLHTDIKHTFESKNFVASYFRKEEKQLPFCIILYNKNHLQSSSYMGELIGSLLINYYQLRIKTTLITALIKHTREILH